jgi:hypothetical protein
MGHGVASWRTSLLWGWREEKVDAWKKKWEKGKKEKNNLGKIWKRKNELLKF